MRPIHEVLKERRLEWGISQVVMSEYMGVHPVTYCQYENGYHSMNAETLLEFMAIFDIKLEEICGRKYDEKLLYKLLKETEERKELIGRPRK